MATVLERPTAYAGRDGSIFAISSDHPVPAGAGTRGGRLYPFGEMQVGDSFDVPLAGSVSKSARALQNSISHSALCYAKKHMPSARFTTRIINGDLVRVWRFA